MSFDLIWVQYRPPKYISKRGSRLQKIIVVNNGKNVKPIEWTQVDAYADLSLSCAHCSFYWYYHTLAHLTMVKCMSIQ